MSKSVNSNRLNPDNQNYLEMALSELWQDLDRDGHNMEPTISHLLIRRPCISSDPNIAGEDYNGCYTLPIGELTEDKKVLIATVIQWMGTSCGQALMNDAYNKAAKLESESLA